MLPRVRPRVVAAPWERGDTSSRLAESIREANLEPEPGPLALYLSVFPDRYVRWDAKRQLWEIREKHPLSSEDWRVEFVFTYDSPPDPDTGEARSEDELATLIGHGAATLVKVFRPFDYEFVRERIRQRREYEATLGRYATLRRGLRAYSDRIADRNRRTWLSRIRHVASESAAMIAEYDRWMEPIARAFEARAKGDPRDLDTLVEKYKDTRRPLVAGGLTR